MLNHIIRRMLRLLPFVLTIFLLSSCGVQKKQVSHYQDRSSQPVNASQNHPETSKSLPDVKDVQSDKYDVGQKRSNEVEQNAMTPGEILPALTLVADRIIAYENKKKEWDEFSVEALKINLDGEQQDTIVQCQRQIQSILTGYNALHENLLKDSSGQVVKKSSADQVVAVERNDISFLESECQQIVNINQQSGGWIAGTKYRLFEEMEQQIAQAMEQNDFLLVIDLYKQLLVESSRDASIETTYDYGQALLRIGNVKEAEQVFIGLLERLRRESQVKREFQIMKLVADINFGMEEYTRAFERYVDIINRYAGLGENVEWARRQQSVIGSRNQMGTEVRYFAELMRAYLTYNAERDGYRVVVMARNFVDGYPESIQYPAAARILFEAEDSADAWFAGVIVHVNRLKVEKKYEEGLMLIEQLPRLHLLSEKQDQLRILADELISGQFEEAETSRQAIEKELQETWNLGQGHLRAKEYDQAIEVFSILQDTAYSERAMIQIEEAVHLAAQENRSKAAELFVQASSTRELEKRTELLLASRELLLSILIKYPQSDLGEKVKRNLSRIEEDIRAIDPALLDLKTDGTPSGSHRLDSVPPFDKGFSPNQENGQVDSPIYTGKEFQE